MIDSLRDALPALTLGVLISVGAAANARSGDDLALHADSAPNVFGSPDWPQWWTDTKADVVAGAFTDMRTGVYPGTHKTDPYDFIVYSTMDLGKRVHWIYWLPGESVANLDERFEVKWVVDWDGIDYTYDWDSGQLIPEDPNLGWIQPASWVDYDDGQGNTGVIGSFGFAWWATDNEAKPFNTDGDPYNETDQADVDALRVVVASVQTHLTGLVRLRASTNDPWVVSDLPLILVPRVADLDGLQMATGTQLAGGVDDLLASDDLRVHTRSGYGQAFTDLHKMEMIVHATTIVDSPASLTITVEAAIDEPDGTARILLRNWNTDVFEQVAQYDIGLDEEAFTVAGIDPANYVNASGEIDVMVKHNVHRPLFAFQFESWIDWVEIVVD